MVGSHKIGATDILQERILIARLSVRRPLTQHIDSSSELCDSSTASGWRVERTSQFLYGEPYDSGAIWQGHNTSLKQCRHIDGDHYLQKSITGGLSSLSVTLYPGIFRTCLERCISRLSTLVALEAADASLICIRRDTTKRLAFRGFCSRNLNRLM